MRHNLKPLSLNSEAIPHEASSWSNPDYGCSIILHKVRGLLWAIGGKVNLPLQGLYMIYRDNLCHKRKEEYIIWDTLWISSGMNTTCSMLVELPSDHNNVCKTCPFLCKDLEGQDV